MRDDDPWIVVDPKLLLTMYALHEVPLQFPLTLGRDAILGHWRHPNFGKEAIRFQSLDALIQCALRLTQTRWLLRNARL